MKDRQEIRPIVITLGKLLVFAAWADGEIKSEEYEVIRDQLFVLPDLTEEEWASVLIYMEYPMTEFELTNLIKDFNFLVKTPARRDYAIEAITRVVAADGVVTAEEQEALDHLKQNLKEDTLIEKLVELLKRILGLSRRHRQTSAAQTYNREKDLEDFLKNPVFFRLAREAKTFSEPLQFTKHELRKLCLAGAIMAKVAQADHFIHDDEVAVIFEALSDTWMLSDNGALLVLSIALNKNYGDMDMLRICRHFYEVSNSDERLQLFFTLVEIADADGSFSSPEIDVLVSIAGHLKIYTSTVHQMLNIEQYSSPED